MIKFLWFSENFSHWSKFKGRSHGIIFSQTFDLLFISSSIDIYCLEFLSHHIKKILYINRNSKRNQSWNKNNEIFSIDVEKSCFSCRIKIPYLQFLIFHELFQKHPLADVPQNGCSKKIAIFWIKKCLQHRCFPVNIAKFLRTDFLRYLSGGYFCIL